MGVEVRKTQKVLRRIMRSYITITVLLVVFMFITHGAWEVYKKARTAKIERDRTLSELVDLRDRKESLEHGSGDLQTEYGIETEIREKFSVAKEGEEVVIIIDTPVRDDQDNYASGGGNRVWDWVKGIF